MSNLSIQNKDNLNYNDSDKIALLTINSPNIRLTPVHNDLISNRNSFKINVQDYNSNLKINKNSINLKNINYNLKSVIPFECLNLSK